MGDTKRSQGEQGSIAKSRDHNVILESGAPVAWMVESLNRIVTTTT